MTQQASILIVDDVPSNLDLLVDYFLDRGLDVLVATSGEAALDQLALTTPDIILLDVMMPGLDGFETCRRIRARADTGDTPILFMTALADTASKVRGFELGAADYVTKPFQVEEVAARVTTHLRLRDAQRSLARANAELEARVAARTAELSQAVAELERLKAQLEAENTYLHEELELTHRFEQVVGESAALKQCLRRVEQVAPTDATVLILGETGTGKEVFARAIHDHSARRARPMIKVNCAALAHSVIESELFGHERGAFTGAAAQRIGRFELADGSTLFLDEVGELPLELQAKLLRVLQEGEFERLGASKTRKVDVRIVAATNRDLAEAVHKGSFREDLYYRLNVFPLRLPPLRERMEDLPLLVRYFVARLGQKVGRAITQIPPGVIARLERYHWPGNIRELEHTLERAVIMSPGPSLELADFAPAASGRAQPSPTATSTLATLEEAERQHILRALALTRGRVSGPRGAAQLLAINPKTLESRMKRLDIQRGRDFSL